MSYYQSGVRSNGRQQRHSSPYHRERPEGRQLVAPPPPRALFDRYTERGGG